MGLKASLNKFVSAFSTKRGRLKYICNVMVKFWSCACIREKKGGIIITIIKIYYRNPKSTWLFNIYMYIFKLNKFLNLQFRKPCRQIFLSAIGNNVKVKEKKCLFLVAWKTLRFLHWQQLVGFVQTRKVALLVLAKHISRYATLKILNVANFPCKSFKVH